MRLKYAAAPFGHQGGEDLLKAAWGLLVKIHIITGWNMPQSEAFQNELVKQFALKLQESYPNVNSEELEYAFRQNTSVKDWGKAMNLNLIDEVLAPYLAQRREISEREERAKPLPLPLVDKAQIDRDYWAAVSYSRLKTLNKVGPYKLKVK